MIAVRVLICWMLFLFWGITPVGATLTLTEVYANPPGDETVGEWIELYNPGTASESTTGYVLRDGVGAVKQFTLPTATVSAKSYLLIWRTLSGISLNNDGEEVILVNPTGASESSGVFVAAEGKSWTKSSGRWGEALPTPGYAEPELSFAATSSGSTVNGASLPGGVAESSSSSGVTLSTSSASTAHSALVDAVGADPMEIHLSEVAACASPLEWVELEVTGAGFPLSLAGWSLQDGSGNLHDLGGLSVTESGFIILEWKSGWLTNTGESISIRQHNRLIEEVDLPACVFGQSYQRFADGWKMTSTPSPGTRNATASAEGPLRMTAFQASSEISETADRSMETEMEQFSAIAGKKIPAQYFFSSPVDLRASASGFLLPESTPGEHRRNRMVGVPVVKQHIPLMHFLVAFALGVVLVGQMPVWWQFRARILESIQERLGLALHMLPR